MARSGSGGSDGREQAERDEAMRGVGGGGGGGGAVEGFGFGSGFGDRVADMKAHRRLRGTTMASLTKKDILHGNAL